MQTAITPKIAMRPQCAKGAWLIAAKKEKHEIEKISALMVRSRKMETPPNITIFCMCNGKLATKQYDHISLEQ